MNEEATVTEAKIGAPEAVPNKRLENLERKRRLQCARVLYPQGLSGTKGNRPAKADGRGGYK